MLLPGRISNPPQPPPPWVAPAAPATGGGPRVIGRASRRRVLIGRHASRPRFCAGRHLHFVGGGGRRRLGRVAEVVSSWLVGARGLCSCRASSLPGRGGGLVAEQEPPPQSEVEVGEWRRRRSRGHVGGRAPHCWGKEVRSGEPGGARGRPGGPGSRAGLEQDGAARKQRTFRARAVTQGLGTHLLRAVKIVAKALLPSGRGLAANLVSWNTK